MKAAYLSLNGLERGIRIPISVMSIVWLMYGQLLTQQGRALASLLLLVGSSNHEKGIGAGVRTVDNGTEVLHVLDNIPIRSSDRPDFVEDFLPKACHDFRVHGKHVNDECKCRSGCISAG